MSDNESMADKIVVWFLFAIYLAMCAGLVMWFRSCMDLDDGPSFEQREQSKLRESLKKIDRGEQLSPAEEKRLNDILFSPTDGDN